MLLKTIFEPSDEGGYTVYVPSLPGCISEGDTLDEARANIREAIALYSEPIDEPVAPPGGLIEELAVCGGGGHDDCLSRLRHGGA